MAPALCGSDGVLVIVADGGGAEYGVSGGALVLFAAAGIGGV